MLCIYRRPSVKPLIIIHTDEYLLNTESYLGEFSNGLQKMRTDMGYKANQKNTGRKISLCARSNETAYEYRGKLERGYQRSVL